MNKEHLEKLQAVLSELLHNGPENLTDNQKQLISEAQSLLVQVDTHTTKNKMDWSTIANLGLQAAKIIIELLKSG